MAYKLKPNYHFSDMFQTGIDKVPVGRFIIVEDVGNDNEIKWYKKVSSDLLDSEGAIIEPLGPTHTLNDALGNYALVAPLDEKRDILDSYSQTEVDSALTLKADVETTYSKDDVDTILTDYRTNATSYSITEIDSLLDGVAKNTDGIVEHTFTISANYSISEGAHAISMSPLNLTDGVEIFIPNESRWKILE